MTPKQVREMILTELPKLMRGDDTFREAVLSITHNQYADRTDMDERFNHVKMQLDRTAEHPKILSSLTAIVGKLGKTVDKLEQRLDHKITADHEKWAKNQQRWDENQKQITALTSAIQSLEQRLEQKIEEDRKKWAENQKQMTALSAAIQSLEQRFEQKIEEDRKKWAENDKRWDQNDRRWDENDKRWDENDKRWDENDKRWDENDKAHRKLDQRLMAMGARWGIDTESTFRNALAGIISTEFPDVQVIHVDERDDEGIVFGYPEEIELDVIIKNGMLIIGEIKSSVHKSDIYTFERKVRFYEQKKGKPVTRKIVISPMVDKRALPVAKKLEMEIYSFADDVDL